MYCFHIQAVVPNGERRNHAQNELLGAIFAWLLLSCSRNKGRAVLKSRRLSHQSHHFMPEPGIPREAVPPAQPA